MIQFSRVTKTYRSGSVEYTALKGVDFTISQGEMVAIIGPSGSGKSTIMNIMGLLDRPSSGEYRLDGQVMEQLSGAAAARLRNQNIGFVFQSFHLLPRLSALQNIALPLQYAGVNPAQANQRAQALLEQLNMSKHAHHRPSALSGGQQQRIAIARALANQPHIILADEPTGALDSNTSQTILDLLVSLRSQATIVIITHDQHVAAQCERIIEIKDGLIQQHTQ